MKKIITILLSIFISLPFFNGKIVNAASAGSRENALNWVYAQEGKYLDYDGVYGAQCVDFVRYYYDYFGQAKYATGNACDFVSNTLPSGWTRIKNTSDFIPEPGDIAVWGTELSTYGHVAVILSANQSSFVSMDQNWPSGSCIKKVTHTYNKFWGVIRPNFDNEVVNNPIGTVDNIVGDVGSVTVYGWAYDWDDINTSIKVHVYIGGEAGSAGSEGHEITADSASPDLVANGISGNHSDVSIKTVQVKWKN